MRVQANDQKVDVWVMGHLVTQFQGQTLRAAANNRVCRQAGAAMPRLPLYYTAFKRM